MRPDRGSQILRPRLPLAQACETVDRKGGLHELDRKRVKTGTGY